MHEVESATIESLRDHLREFVARRAWEPFQTPKNLAMALTVECGELLEEFQWLAPEASRDLAPDKRGRVAAEMADVLLFLIRLADELGVDLLVAARDKMAANEAKYPPETSAGRAPRA